MKQTIIDLEFANSTNAAQEILEYKNKTQFFLNSTIRSKNCNLFGKGQSDSNQYVETITKNGTNYYTIFTELNACYGNHYEQKKITVGYLAHAISE